jgi:NAD(P)-dependent dehydrogenase (short-subunit alcohol dehydrogenase family)
VRTALVTGGNRGLGLETCKQLASRGYRVILTSRSASGARVASSIGVEHRSLDVTGDLQPLVDSLAGTTLDVLVNNAAISLDGFNADVAKRTLDANYFGAERVTLALLPFLSPHANVVMVSSGLGALSGVSSSLRRELLDPALDRARLDALMRGFVEAVARGKHRELGWPSSAYSVSKVGINALARVLAREHPNLRVNAVCPGWVRTAMGGSSAPRSVEDGAASIVAATDTDATGEFFRDGRVIEW